MNKESSCGSLAHLEAMEVNLMNQLALQSTRPMATYSINSGLSIQSAICLLVLRRGRTIFFSVGATTSMPGQDASRSSRTNALSPLTPMMINLSSGDHFLPTGCIPEFSTPASIVMLYPCVLKGSPKPTLPLAVRSKRL